MARLTAKKVGRRVQAYRERLGWTRPELAQRLGIDRTHVWRIERGEALPSLSLLDQMCRELGVSLNAISGGEGL